MMKDKCGRLPLHIASIEGCSNVLQYMIDCYIQTFTKDALLPSFIDHPDDDGNTAMVLATSKGNIDIIQILLSYHSNYNVLCAKG